VVEIRQCAGTGLNQAKTCKGISAMQIRAQAQNFFNQTEQTSKLNLSAVT